MGCKGPCPYAGVDPKGVEEALASMGCKGPCPYAGVDPKGVEEALASKGCKGLCPYAEDGTKGSGRLLKAAWVARGIPLRGSRKSQNFNKDSCY